MQIKIKPKIGLFLLTLLFLSTIVVTAQALEVKFCVPDCVTDTTPQIRGAGTPLADTPAIGVTTNTITIASFVYKGFTISGTAVAQQSGTLQKITFNPTVITANTTAGCNIGPTTALPAQVNPCQIEIIATSHVADFPVRKPTGGYPAGVFMAGYFTGTQAAKPNGDTISMTAEASGLSDATPGLAINSDVINATPGASAGDAAVSLPSSCTGSATCNFMATSLVKSFNSQITETVQQQCDAGLSDCLTRLRTKVNVSIKKAGNKVNLPTDVVHVDSEEAVTKNINPAALLITTIGSPFDVDVKHLLVYRNNFALDGRFTLDEINTIDPATEEVSLNIGGKFAMTIPVGKCKRLLNGKLFTCLAKLDGGLDVVASFTRGTNPSGPWTFAAAVSGVSLKPVLVSPTTQVELAVGSDHGRDNLVTAAIFQ